MATVTVLTAARMLDIEANSVVSGTIVGDNLILTKHDASTINAGNVRGPAGPTGPAGSGASEAYVDAGDASVTAAMTAYVDTEIAGVTAGTAQLPGVTLESFSGATDDIKLGNAMSTIAAETYKRPILLLQNRDYNFTTTREVFNGFGFMGNYKPQEQFRSSGAGVATSQRVRVNISNGPLFRLPASGDVFGMAIQNLSFYSDSSTTDWFQGTAGCVAWTSVIGRDCGFSLFRNVLGSPTTKFLNTACELFGGFVNINNSRGVAVTIGGSDTVVGTGMVLLDSPPTIYTAGTRSHFRCDFQEKTSFGRFYVTAEGTIAALEILGSSSSGAGLVFNNWVCEGRNISTPATGALILVNGARVKFRDFWLAYGMTSPGTNPRGTEAGLVHCTNGAIVTIGGATVARATGVAETVPMAYATGTGTTIHAVQVDTDSSGGAFTAGPRVRIISPAVLGVTDSTITYVSV